MKRPLILALLLAMTTTFATAQNDNAKAPEAPKTAVVNEIKPTTPDYVFTMKEVLDKLTTADIYKIGPFLKMRGFKYEGRKGEVNDPRGYYYCYSLNVELPDGGLDSLKITDGDRVQLTPTGPHPCFVTYGYFLHKHTRKWYNQACIWFPADRENYTRFVKGKNELRFRQVTPQQDGNIRPGYESPQYGNIFVALYPVDEDVLYFDGDNETTVHVGSDFDLHNAIQIWIGLPKQDPRP